MPVKLNAAWGDSFPGVRHRYAVDASVGAGAITLATVELEPGAEVPLHSHPVEDAFVILHGSGVFRCGDASHQVSAGSGCLAPANVPHGLKNTGSEKIVLVFAWPAVNVRRDLHEPTGPVLASSSESTQ